jgi:hypothetical protein
LILAPHTSAMSDLLAEILSEPKVISALSKQIDGHYISLPELDRMRLQLLELEIGQAAMANELARIRKELAKEKAAKVAILASWKYSMMQVKQAAD